MRTGPLRQRAASSVTIGVIALTVGALAACGGSAEQPPPSGTTPAKPVSSPSSPAASEPPARTLADGDTIVDSRTVPFGSVATDGHTLVVRMSPYPSAARLRTIDLATGKTLTELDSSSQAADGKECDVRVVRRSDDVSLLISTRVEIVAAQGIDAGSATVILRARDAATGRSLWESPLLTVPKADSGPDCYPFGMDTGSVDQLKFTSDGRYALSLRPATPLVVDLATGKSRPLAKAVDTLGRWVLTAAADDGSFVRQMALVNPETLAEEGRISDEMPVIYLSGPGVSGLGGSKVGVGILDDIMVSNGRNPNADPGFPDLIGYRLPSFTTIWSIQQKAAPQGLGERFDPAPQADLFVANYPGVSGLDPATGAIRWQLPPIEDYCGTANGRVYVVANGQFAVVDAKTGKQLTFDPESKTCPKILDGALMTEHRDNVTGAKYYLIEKQ